MTDYIGTILTGLFTGIGVIAANKIWQKMEEHRLAIREKINTFKENVPRWQTT